MKFLKEKQKLFVIKRRKEDVGDEGTGSVT
jgi:hypothetical protein